MQNRQGRIVGISQGIGLRPFIKRSADRYQLRGWVRNEEDAVVLIAQGADRHLEGFGAAVKDYLARFGEAKLQWHPIDDEPPLGDFQIRPSAGQQNTLPVYTSDLAICPSCRDELLDKKNRRFAYPFIACCQCGPRFSIVKKLPYDRNHTSMQSFPPCPDCLQEYGDEGNRRFHQQDICCAQCGPQLFYRSHTSEQDREQALQQAAIDIRQGQVVAVKGSGGFHLVCDATQPQAIETLRRYKQRPHKPLAVMMSLAQARREVHVDPVAQQLLQSSAAPIALLERAETTRLPMWLAPGLNKLGVMLPYSPLHLLLLHHCERPLVVTSANLPGAPIIYENASAESQLGILFDSMLYHNRDILNPQDDAVYQIIDEQPRPLRPGRGRTPVYLPLPKKTAHDYVAHGAWLKNTVAISHQNTAINSAHVGELSHPAVLQRQRAHLQTLCTLHHPGPAQAQRHISEQNVLHHHAHASALAGEYLHEQRWLVFTWDGTGWGENRSLWGGETFLGRPGHWQRVASLRPFKLPGGEQAIRNPWRIGRSLQWHCDMATARLSKEENLLYQAWTKNINAPLSSSAGRLFDAAAALLGLCETTTYEGQAAMMLEAMCCDEDASIELDIVHENGLLRCDWRPLLPMLMDESRLRCQRATLFHLSLVTWIVKLAHRLKAEYGDFAVGLTGGVFQNRYLSDKTLSGLRTAGFRCYYPQQLPVNDAGIAYGQLVDVIAREPLPHD